MRTNEQARGKTADSIEYCRKHGIFSFDIKMVPQENIDYAEFMARHVVPVLYSAQKFEDYMAFRNMGFRAITAFGLAKYGMDFLVSYVVNPTDSARTE